MKCPFCSQEIADGSSICPICGKELSPAAESGAGSAEAAAPAAADQAEEAAPETADQAEEAAPETAVQAEKAAPAQAAAEAIAAEAEIAAPEAAAPEAPKKGKKWVIPVVGAAVVVVAAGAFMLSNRKDPKDTVIEAFKSITAEGQTNPAEEIFGISELTEMLNTASNESYLELALEGASDESINQFATGSIGFTGLNDVENGKTLLEMNLGYGGADLASLQFYLDDAQMVAAIPELSSKAFTIYYAEDLEGQIANSPVVGPLLAESGVDAEALGDYFSSYNEMVTTQSELFDLGALWKRYKEGSAAIENLKAAMTVEKGEKKEFTIDGAAENCQGYQVTLTKDALLSFITATKDFLLEDETLKNDFVEYMGLVYDMQNAMMTATIDGSQTPEEMQQQTWQEAEEAFEAMVAQLEESLGDVSMNVYVRGDGKMAGFDYDTTATMDGQELRLYGETAFGGGYSMLANASGTLNIEAGGEVVTIALRRNSSYEAGKVWSDNLEAELGDGIDSFRFVLSDTYQLEGDGAYDLTLDFLSGDASQLKVTATGAVNNVVKGKSFDFALDSILVESDALLGEGGYLELSGNLGVKPLEQEVTVPAGETFDVLAATESDYDEVLSEMTGSLFGLMMSLY